MKYNGLVLNQRTQFKIEPKSIEFVTYNIELIFVCLSICLNYQEIPLALTNEIEGETSLNNGKFLLDFSLKKM